MLKTQRITLEKRGVISGDVTGSWTMKDGTDCTYVTLSISGVNYKGVFFLQTNDNNEKKNDFYCYR